LINENMFKMRKEKASLAYRNKELYKLQRRGSKLVTGFFLVVIILGLSFVIIYPFMKLFPVVLNHFDDLGSPEVVWIPKRFSLTIFKIADYIVYADRLLMVKSLLYAFTIAIIQTMMSAMAGYAFARIDFKGRNLLFALVLFTFIVPPQALLISQYLRFKEFDIFGLIRLFTGDDLDLINRPITLYILAFLGFGMKQSLFIFIFRQFFLGIPNELEEAALIDGCGFYKTYFKVMLPNSVPAMMTVMVFSFVWNYGDTYYTRYFHPKGPYLSIILLDRFANNNEQMNFVRTIAWRYFGVETWSVFTFDAVKQAALIIYLIPLLILYFIIQRRFVENFERSGIVG